MNLAIVLVLLAVIPTVLISTLIYRKDIVEKESSSLLARLFAGGILSAFLVIVVSSIAILFIPFLGQEISELGYFEMFISIFIAKSIGSGLPILAKVCKLDPAIMSGPLVTTIVDASTVALYYGLARLLLM